MQAIDPARIRSFTNSYDALLYALDLLGVTTLDAAMQALPHMLPRTLRRAFARRQATGEGGDAGSVPMGMCSISEPKAQTHTDTTEAQLQLAERAGSAGISAKVALMAVMRYGNTVERVSGVIDDIRALIAHGCRIYNPTGLFVRTCRSGTSIKLPAVVQAAREARDEQRQAESKVEPVEPGMWALIDGDWLQVERIVGTNVELSAPAGYAYRYVPEGYDARVPLERVRKAQRAPSRPVG